ncbi:hypothetical protein L1987_40613 [Smallanthus sonchifolius]|uniref:Uncharacterized protein n=1 Tax=Smallanthus sonchifolius TaxID=185202 RepID=A0ACB9GVI5_9ASTR|nr:hypothetical protein L1987_40613 [Smallanthus sonchifolius]
MGNLDPLNFQEQVANVEVEANVEAYSSTNTTYVTYQEIYPSVPRVKKLSLEVMKLNEQMVQKDEEIKSLKTDLVEQKEEVNDLKLEVVTLQNQLDLPQTQLVAQQALLSKQQQELLAVTSLVNQIKLGGTNVSQSIATGGPSSPTFITNPESAVIVYTGEAEKPKDSVEVKVEQMEYDLPSTSQRRDDREKGKGKEADVDLVILDEEEVGSDHELDGLLKQIDDFGTVYEFPEIVTLGEEHQEKLRYITETGDEIEALTDTDEEDPSLPVEEPPKHYEWFAEYQELKRPHVGWKYDKECSLFIVRRYKEGVEHFKSPDDFSSLPKYDLRALAKLPLQNTRNVYDHCKTQRVLSKTSIHPRTQNPWVSLRYKPEKTVKSIQLLRSVPVQLQKFKRWFYNSTIGSAVIECEGMKDIHIYEPMELLKFQPEEMEVLLNHPCRSLM